MGISGSAVTPQQSVVVNGQQQLLSPPLGQAAATASPSTGTPAQAATSPKEFVLTPDYIQQSKSSRYNVLCIQKVSP